ncbi:MAG: PrgI family protein, partial [Nanoarchaeota archaeon]|nr:PrgI family protein [Nanoarchaeota archaeon]
MAYQIPQQLEYKEKIMFGLTFKQLAYAFLFGSIAIILFNKINHQILKFTLASIPSCLGICFMFFNLDAIIKDYFIYLKQRKIFKYDPRLEKLISVKSIDNNIIETDKKIAILNVQAINYSIKPSKEQEAIIQSFQKFLNSIDFPIQILMSTESLELSDYLTSLKSRIKESNFMELFAKYKKHLQNIISSNKIMNRVFYVIIPESTNLEIQLNICMERLENLNLKVERLSTKELKQLLTKFFSGTGKGSLINSLSPDYMLNYPTYLNTNKKYCRIIYASGYPRAVEAGFLDRIVSSLGDFDLSMHIKPYPIETMLINLNKELQKQRADLYAMQSKAAINPSLQIQYNDTRKTLEQLQKGKEKLFNISLYINCKADSLDELEMLTKRVEAELNSLMIIPGTANLRMLQGFKSMAPLGADELNFDRNITTEALSAFFPFTSQFSRV